MNGIKTSGSETAAADEAGPARANPLTARRSSRPFGGR